jgi:hypothetical protein
MFSRAIVSYRLRYYSAPKKALKLWIKHNESPPTQVAIKDCVNLDDFAKKVKEELNTNCQVALFTSLENAPIDPGLEINKLLKTEFLNNCSKFPLFVKTNTASKTIRIRDIDEKCRPLNSYTAFIVGSDADMKVTYESKGSALYLVTDPKNALTKFNQLQDGEKYGVLSIYG